MSEDIVFKDPFVPHDIQLCDPFQDPDIEPSSPSGRSTSSSPEPSPHSTHSHLRSPFSDTESFFGNFEDYVDPAISHSAESSAEKGDRLFSGSPLSVVQTLAILISWFCSFPGISKQAFSQLLFLLHTFVLPSGNLLPTHYNAALSLIATFLLPVKEYHCCVNDCVVYRNSPRAQYQHLAQCPHCGEDRYLPWDPDST